MKKYSAFVIMILFCLCGYSVARSYGFTVFPDEFGYWAYAAEFAGYDWSDIVSLGSYYSYGYSIILYPIFTLCQNAVTAYRMAIVVNFFLLGLSFFLWKGLTQKLFREEKKETAAFYAAIAVCYPSWLFYARTTLAEIVIATLYAVICVLFYHYFEHNKRSTAVLLIAALVYIHFVHMRTIAIPIAGAITMAGYYAAKKKKVKNIFLMFLAFASAFIVGFFIKEWATGGLYEASKTLATNDYAGQLGKIAYIFTWEGLRDFLISLSGKVLYLGIASFGLGFLGIKYAVKKIYMRKESSANTWFYVFVLLSTLGATLINAIYTVGPGRIDALTYGRYHEYVLPILMILGIKELSENKKTVRDFGVILILEIVLTGMVAWSLTIYGQDNLHGYMMVGMSYLHQPDALQPISFYWRTLCFGVVLTAAVMALIRFVHMHKGMEALMALVLVLELALTMKASDLYLDDSARGAYRDTKLVERIERLTQEEDREIYYCLHNDSYDLISILQFMMREKDIRILDDKELFQEENAMEAKDLLLLDYRDPLTQEMKESYDNFFENGHFVLYYND